MKRPFFLLAVVLSVFILLLHHFIKEKRFPAGHISSLALRNPRQFVIKGRVISDPFFEYRYFRKTQVFIVSPELARVRNRWIPTYGDIRVTSYNETEVEYADDLLFEATLRRPSSGEQAFDYRRYLEIKDIFALGVISDNASLIVLKEERRPSLRYYAFKVKDVLEQRIEGLFKKPERYFLSAVLLGERQDIFDEWKDIFVKTQTMHLLAISGLHVGIIIFIILFFLTLLRIPRNYRYAMTVIILVFYALMIQGQPSVMRATVMGVVILNSYLLKRDADIYNSLGLAAVVILVFNPEQLFDYGFILSFVSVFSIIYMMPRINSLCGFYEIDRRTMIGTFKYYCLSLISASLSVWLGLLPLTLNFFNIISPISILVNVVAIPLFFVIMTLSVSALIFHSLFPPLGIIFAESAEFYIAVLLSCLKRFSELPFAYFEAESTNIFMTPIYYIMLFLLFERKRLRKFLLAGKNCSP